MATFTVMTWNVQNLFLPTDNDGPDNQAIFQEKLNSLAFVIDQQRPHILALQEVGPNGALHQNDIGSDHAAVVATFTL